MTTISTRVLHQVASLGSAPTSLRGSLLSRSLTVASKRFVSEKPKALDHYRSVLRTSSSLGAYAPRTAARMGPWTSRRAFSSSSTQETNQKKFGSFMEWYEHHLQERPVLTKMITGCFLWGLGDAVAQIVPQLVPSTDHSDHAPKKEAASWSQILAQYDTMRTGRAVLFGFALHAPTSHVHFNFLEWMTQRAGVTGLGIPLFKAFMEQFVYWSWISNSMYHAAMGAMQGMTPAQISQRIHDVLWETQKAQWAFWIPVQLLNFRYVPVRHQLNVVLLTSVVWTALLSAWYPPEPPQAPPTEDSKESASS